MTAIHCQRIEAALRKAKPGTGERYQKLARLHWQSAALAATLETRLRLTPSSKLDKRTPTDGELQWPDKEKGPGGGAPRPKGAYRLSHAAWVARHGPGIGVWFFHPPVENGEHQMIRAALAVASAAAIGLGAHIAAAQQDPIAARKALMKGNADQAKIGADMTKGEAPFDLAKVKKIFATFEDTAAKAPALFPEHSIDQPTADDPYTASPKIWENMDDFKARLAKFGSDAKAASASVKDLESFKKAFGNIGKNDCGSCHEKYRLKQS